MYQVVVAIALFFFVIGQAASTPVLPSHAVILQYHHVSENTPNSTSTSVALFKAHLDYFDAHGFQVWSLQRVIEQLRAGHQLPDKVIALTFDDGYRSVYTSAYPLLKEKGWPFSVFVSTDYVGANKQLYVNWDELSEMAQHGALIGNHTQSHPHLLRKLAGETDAMWQRRVRQEIEGAQRIIDNNVGTQYRILAYPYGEYDEEVKQIVKSLGYVGLAQQSGPVGITSDWLALPRFPFANRYGGIKQIRDKLYSLPLVVLERAPSTSYIGSLPPQLKLILGSDDISYKRASCFASGQGQISTSSRSGNAGIIIDTSAMKPLPVGRSRYNCTFPSKNFSGRFYWYSVQWLRKKDNGDWWEES